MNSGKHRMRKDGAVSLSVTSQTSVHLEMGGWSRIHSMMMRGNIAGRLRTYPLGSLPLSHGVRLAAYRVAGGGVALKP